MRPPLVMALLLLLVAAAGGCTGSRKEAADGDTGRRADQTGTQLKTAAAASPTGFATRDALVQARVTALRNQDLEALKRTLHPRCLASITPESEPLFKRLFTSELNKTIADTYQVEYVPYQPNDPAVINGDFSYPLEPLEEANVRFEPTYRTYVTLIWPIAQDQGRWYVIAPVPTAQLLERLGAEESRRAQFRPRARELAAELKEPLRSELLGYIREDRQHTAARRYRQEFDVDMADAELVIEALEETLEKTPE